MSSTKKRAKSYFAASQAEQLTRFIKLSHSMLLSQQVPSLVSLKSSHSILWVSVHSHGGY